MTLGLFWKFPAGGFHAVKLSWNNSNAPGGKASCFPRSAWDLLLRSFSCSPHNNHLLGKEAFTAFPKIQKKPIFWSPYANGRFLHAVSVWMKLFYEPKSIALKEDKIGVRDCKSPGKGSTSLSLMLSALHPHSFSVVPTSRETVPWAA